MLLLVFLTSFSVFQCSNSSFRQYLGWNLEEKNRDEGHVRGPTRGTNQPRRPVYSCLDFRLSNCVGTCSTLNRGRPFRKLQVHHYLSMRPKLVLRCYVLFMMARARVLQIGAFVSKPSSVPAAKEQPHEIRREDKKPHVSLDSVLFSRQYLYIYIIRRRGSCFQNSTDKAKQRYLSPMNKQINKQISS